MNEKMKEKTTMRKHMNGIWVITIATLLIAAGIVAVLIMSNEESYNDYNPYQMLNRFSSYEELKEYVKNTASSGPKTLEGGDGLLTTGSTASPSPEGYSLESSSAANRDYSTTNIQVEGVDEADIVKTDGEYLYVISEYNVTVVKAYPAKDAKVLSRIELDSRPIEIFLNDDRLIIFEHLYGSNPYLGECYNCHPLNTLIKVYDVATPSSPILLQNISVSGTYFDSRRVDDYVYVVTTQYLWFGDDRVMMPVIQKNGIMRTVKATEVGYFKVAAPSYSFAIVLSISINANSTFRFDVYLTDAAQSMYASTENIYLASRQYTYRTLSTTESSDNYPKEKTWIHKISIDSGNIKYVQSVRVPGTVLNQFSMDEHKRYFRIATTTGQVWNGNSKNNIYILDDKLNLAGKIEGLAQGERIYSARFMGDRVYLVTFRQVDPFFVIDLSDPEKPRMLGELKIPGYSDYLHPYDENHIIGLGKDGRTIKLSLFDVTDVRHPKEISKYLVSGDCSFRYADSYALRDHKAFTFSKSKNLLIIPVTLEDYDYYNYSIWQGAYVFSLTLDNGFELKGRITHDDNTSEPGNDTWYYYSPYDVKRSLYIENDIYTVSEKMIKINRMDTLQELKKITI